MDRVTIIILCVVFIIIWMVLKRIIKGKSTHKPARVASDSLVFNLDKWFSRAQDLIAVMNPELLSDRQKEWDKLSNEKQIALSTEFLERNLTDIREVKNLTNEELARIGKAYFISQLDK